MLGKGFSMEQWEKDYIDAVTKSRQAKEQGRIVDCSYEEGYDSSRWVEITLPDGKKHYVPKEAVGNRSGKRKGATHYRDYYETCWNEVEKRPGVSFERKRKQKPQRYYSEKVSFFRTVLKTVKRLIILLALAVLAVGLTQDKPEVQTTIAAVYALGSLGVVLYSIYFIIRCLIEGNLRL